MAKKEESVFDSATEGEIEIVSMLAGGYTDSEMANKLNKSVRTVEGIVGRIRGKYGATTRSQLVALFKDNKKV